MAVGLRNGVATNIGNLAIESLEHYVALAIQSLCFLRIDLVFNERGKKGCHTCKPLFNSNFPTWGSFVDLYLCRR
jgi:hypothetical protein